MASLPVVTVFGATGQQGGGVADQLLNSGKYAVRAITRNTTKPAAQKLAAAGAELVAADMNDEAALAKALEGAWAVFAVTNFWDPANKGQEFAQGERLAKIAKDAGVKVFLWSSLPNAAEGSGGKWQVAHFTQKAKVEPVIAEQGFYYHIYLEPPYYFSAGEVEFNLALSADTVLVGGDPPDAMGEGALGALEGAAGPKAWNGRHVALCSYNQPISTWLSDFESVTGKKAVLKTTPLEDLAKMSEELGEMFGWFQDHGYYGSLDVTTGEQLCGKGAFMDWPAWLKATGWTGGK